MVDNVSGKSDVEDAERKRCKQYGKEGVRPCLSDALVVDQQDDKNAKDDTAIDKNRK